MKVVVLGLGGWISSPWLGYPAIYVETDRRILLDAGEGTYARLAQCGLPFPDVLVLTHAHGDHILGAPTLLLMARQRGTRIKVVATDSVMSSLVRILEAVNMPHLQQYMEPVEVPPGGEAREGDTRIALAAARHSVEAVHVRVEHGGRCVAYSGDTAPSDELVELARGCDLLIHEISGNPGQEEPAHAVGHSTTSDAVEIARRAGVKALLPVHYYLNTPLVPPGVYVYLPYPCASVEL
ncbi:MAG: MBL fold metallo-hydrolase [Thermoproteus sp.]